MVPRLYHDATIVCIGSGPSLTASDLSLVYDACRTDGRHTRSIAVNTAFRYAPWADVLFASDEKWWGWNPDALAFPGLKFALPPTTIDGVTTLQWSTGVGVDMDPTRVRLGGHSGYAAIGVAIHLGAKRIVLLGYDLAAAPDGRQHVHEPHPDGSHLKYEYRRAVYRTLQQPLDRLGIAIINASRRTAIPDIVRMPLAVALASLAEVA